VRYTAPILPLKERYSCVIYMYADRSSSKKWVLHRAIVDTIAHLPPGGGTRS